MVNRRIAPRALLAVVVGLAAAGARGEAGPPCVTELRLSATSAVVGQQLVYVVRVLRRPDVSSADWIEPPGFPSFRTEWLPGRPGDTRSWRDGTPYLVYEERHALFPVRAGQLALPGGRLLCELHAFAGEERRGVEVELAGAVVEVAEPPREGRPPSFTGLVGRLSVHREIEPSSIRLGESLRLRVVLEGAANLWDAPEPPLAGLEHTDLFAHPPELSLDASSILRVRRSFVWDVVPRRRGRLELPAFEMASFDPESQRYEVVQVPALAAEVQPGAAPDAAPPAPAPTAGRPARAAGPPWLGVAAALLLSAAGAAGGWAVRARRRRAAPAREVERALDEADAARARGARAAEEAALARALREALARSVPNAHALAPEELEAIAPGPAFRTALTLLAALEAARFAPDGAAPDAAAVRRAPRALVRGPAAARRD